MSRQLAMDSINEYFESGEFFKLLSERVAVRSESQTPEGYPQLSVYLHQHMIPYLEQMGFTCEVIANPAADDPNAWPLLLAERIEDPSLLTLLTYGHGDVVRGYDNQWKKGLSPWQMIADGDLWYGRGTADNKGQHSVNLAALKNLLEVKGELGFNVKVLLEMGEETGSPGLDLFCQQYQDRLKSDLFIASDGPRVGAQYPTLFLGSRGSMNFDLTIRAREGSHHSGNWGGLLSNSATRLMNAWSCLIDGKGKILVPELLPTQLPESLREAVQDIPVGTGEYDPELSPDWGEPGLTPAERLFGWNTLEILACHAGNPDAPANAIPGSAVIHAQMRFVVGSQNEQFLTIIRRHLQANGFEDVEVTPAAAVMMEATRLDPDDPWVHWAMNSIKETTGYAASLIPNLGGSLPNATFANTLGLPTLWIPHSYPACLQHGPNEHFLGSVAKQSLQIMTGIFWDLAEQGLSIKEHRQ
ncbi:M20 family metallopeptidase [Celerinatantimonas diazotrophica]|uniref:Acetylornithine deacetylase/succinyl-diaminopimelate desuccinylase-like protein n=1 Tax=Celerinatantimonas diazotrophica TaxID=412034 RepID=A0A4R1K3I3_9GAMM|nr:M20 family metallopeptidase [Celerinatantimonas diazotrophica]TCK58622.1 acetylornithine deacetylase/succinyl-diaminopimelate desuccinylase-like protein [Celerinatantimonas diazotrophica]CAG9297251.1 Succinyl-diaminopimelate desuccinylase [Celerinatantimonas diazotrophica]